MKHYKIIVAYDGTDFYGWAQQPGLPTIVQVMQKAFYDAFKHKITLVGISRTDAGVHALGQVARFQTDLSVDSVSMLKAWNVCLPGSILIRHLEEQAIDDFHPFRGIINKTYYYHFFLERPLPFIYRYGTYYPGAIDIGLLKQVLYLFVGTHDFSSFSTGDPIGGNPICTLDHINVHYFKRLGMYQISITGNRFLRHMVRRLVGAAIVVAQKKDKRSVTEVKDIFLQKNSHHILPNAPAKGLLLYKIRYKQ